MAQCKKKVFEALSREFHRDDVRFRKMPGGKEAEYITSRAVMNRLDEIVGPENWWDAYVQWDASTILCKLTIRFEDGTEVTKEDLGACSNFSKIQKDANTGDDAKGGAADAFKRAAVKFGVGRYLYNEGTPDYAAREHITAEPEPEPEPAPEPAPKPKPKSKDLPPVPKTYLLPGKYPEWIRSYVAHVNRSVLERRDDLPADFRFVNLTSLENGIRDMAVNEGMLDPSAADSSLAALTNHMKGLFDADPQAVQDFATEFCKERNKTLRKIKAGA